MSSYSAMNAPPAQDDERAMSEINTTPLVDVMLVLLIVFMITIPVITHTVPLELPRVRNLATQTKPENVALGEFGEVVVLATKGTAAEAALETAGIGHLKGKTVIDTTNPIADAPPVSRTNSRSNAVP